MSWSERFVRDHARKTDRAIHHAYAMLASNPIATEMFRELLYLVRETAPRLLDAPVSSARNLGVDALVNFVRFRGSHIRRAADWSGTEQSWRPAVASLAGHLLCEYEIPVFLASAWYDLDADADQKRWWFVLHARGRSFRSLNLPITMTRRMEHIFLRSQDHLTIIYAVRRAELLALGMPAEFAKEILSSRLATDLRNGEFWRSVWLFLISHAMDVVPTQIGPMIDYIDAIRHNRGRMETPLGEIELAPPQPDFSMKGRTMQSVLRLMQLWHRSLGIGAASFSWNASAFQPLLIEEPNHVDDERPRRWQMTELTNSAQLRSEGAALHHCVASYSDRCRRGISSIWSLRLWHGDKVHHILTVEVDPQRRSIVQARGQANRVAAGRSLRLLQDWAERERLSISI